MSRDYSLKLQQRNNEQLQRQNSILKAKVIELQTQLQEMKHERKQINKQIQDMRQSRQQLTSEFYYYKQKNAQTLQQMNGLFLQKDQQINMIKTQKLVAEQKCRSLQQIARKANRQVGVLMKQLTARQQFINTCLKNERLSKKQRTD